MPFYLLRNIFGKKKLTEVALSVLLLYTTRKSLFFRNIPIILWRFNIEKMSFLTIRTSITLRGRL